MDGTKTTLYRIAYEEHKFLGKLWMEPCTQTSQEQDEKVVSYPELFRGYTMEFLIKLLSFCNFEGVA